MWVETRFVVAPDGTQMAYDQQGSGPPVVLLHGLQASRRAWHECGYVARLAEHFTVITRDARGHGESDAPTDPAAYALDLILGDVLAVADACGAERFALWGYSFGASTALQLAARSKRVRRVAAMGTFFGRVYGEERVGQMATEWDLIATAQANGTLGEWTLPEDEKAHLACMNARAIAACWRGLAAWPVVEPSEIHCPALVYAGTVDSRVAVPLAARRAEIEAAGIRVGFFDGLDHVRTFTERQVVLPPMLAFLLA